MRHYKKGRKLGTDASHTKAIKKNLVGNLFLNDRIKTTLERAKEIRGDVDRIVTWAKRGDVHSRRLAIAYLGNKTLVSEIFSKVEQGLFKDRPGGYSRILRLGKRRGDDATIVIMELVQEPVVKKVVEDEKPAKKAAKKTDKKADAAVVEAEAAVEAEGAETPAEEDVAAEETAEAIDAEEPAAEETAAEVPVVEAKEAPATEEPAAEVVAEDAPAQEEAPTEEEA
jgi:large subunit ribosomal protein L17